MKIFASWLLGLVMGAGLTACIVAPVPCTSPIMTTVLTVPGDAPSDAMTVTLPAVITTGQHAVLDQAKRTAEADGVEPGLLQGIMLTESGAGTGSYKVTGPKNERQYGVGQIELPTALGVLARYPDMWKTFGFHTHTDEEVIAKLVENDAFNIAVASKYVVMLRQSGFRSPAAVAVAYNKGPGGAIGIDPKTDRYAIAVTSHMRTSMVLAPLAGAYHVLRGDTLSGIAAHMRMPLSVSITAIMNANPAAFPDRNPDILSAGIDIVIPALR